MLNSPPIPTAWGPAVVCHAHAALRITFSFGFFCFFVRTRNSCLFAVTNKVNEWGRVREKTIWGSCELESKTATARSSVAMFRGNCISQEHNCMRQVLVYLMRDWVKTSLSCNKAFVLRVYLVRKKKERGRKGKQRRGWIWFNLTHSVSAAESSSHLNCVWNIIKAGRGAGCHTGASQRSPQEQTLCGSQKNSW